MMNNNNVGHYAELTAYNGEKLFTYITETTTAEIIKNWLMPGYWQNIKFLAPIVTDFSDTGTKSILLSVYALSDEIIQEFELNFKYRAESVTINTNNEAFIIDGASC